MGRTEMRIKGLIDQDVVNYKKTSMFIGTAICDWKCCTQLNRDICLCQNSPIAKQETINYSNQKIVDRYINNPLTNAVVIAGLQPFLQFNELIDLIKLFREHTKDDIVIYTGYYKEEIQQQVKQLKQFKNIIIKFGRYKPDQQSHYDRLLGVRLANAEQHAERIS